jgi:hypothetical protein
MSKYYYKNNLNKWITYKISRCLDVYTQNRQRIKGVMRMMILQHRRDTEK